LEEYIVFWKLLAPPHTHPPAFWTAHTSLCKTCIEEQMLQAILTYGVPTVKNPRHSFPMVIAIPAYRAVGQLHREEA